MEGGKILLSDDENNYDYNIYDDNDDDDCDDYGDGDDYPDWDDNGVHLMMTMHCNGVYLIRKFCPLESRFQ